MLFVSQYVSIWMTGWEVKGLISVPSILLMARLRWLYLHTPTGIACSIKLILFHIIHVTTITSLSHDASQIHWPLNSYIKNAHWSVSLLPEQYRCTVRIPGLIRPPPRALIFSLAFVYQMSSSDLYSVMQFIAARRLCLTVCSCWASSIWNTNGMFYSFIKVLN